MSLGTILLIILNPDPATRHGRREARAEEPAVATRAPAEQADPKERRSEDGARIVALSHLWEPWRGA